MPAPSDQRPNSHYRAQILESPRRGFSGLALACFARRDDLAIGLWGDGVLAGAGGGELGAVAEAECAVGAAEVRLDCLRAKEQSAGGFLDGGAVGDDQRDATLLPGCVSAAGWLRAGGEDAWTAGPRPLSMPPGPPMAATPGARVGVLRFDQAQADQSPVLIYPLDRVAVQLQLADHGRGGVKPSRAQRGKRHRPLTSTTQLRKRQTMLSLNERRRTELSTLRPRRSRVPHAPTVSPPAAPARAVARF